MLAKGPLVISFYRGVWSPYCNMELPALEAARPAIEATGANPIAISPQKPASSRRSSRENKLGFPILSDPRNEVAVAFGMRFALSDYLVELYKKLRNNLPQLDAADPGPLRHWPGRHGTAISAASPRSGGSRPSRFLASSGCAGSLRGGCGVRPTSPSSSAAETAPSLSSSGCGPT